MTERQKKALEYVKEKKRITNKEYQNINFVSRQTASRELADLTPERDITANGSNMEGYILFINTNAP